MMCMCSLGFHDSDDDTDDSMSFLHPRGLQSSQQSSARAHKEADMEEQAPSNDGTDPKRGKQSSWIIRSSLVRKHPYTRKNSSSEAAQAVSPDTSPKKLHGSSQSTSAVPARSAGNANDHHQDESVRDLMSPSSSRRPALSEQEDAVPKRSQAGGVREADSEQINGTVPIKASAARWVCLSVSVCFCA
jgi:hypothetical protein